MSWSNPSIPNIPDYTAFLYGFVEIDPLYLPSNSPFIGYALGRAKALVINVAANNTAGEYVLACYNCATHIQLAITPDQPGRDFFRAKRKEYDLLLPVTGLVASSSDQSTSASFAVPDSLAQLTISDLGFMRTPWGRTYLEFNQDFGLVWGLT